MTYTLTSSSTDAGSSALRRGAVCFVLSWSALGMFGTSSTSAGELTAGQDAEPYASRTDAGSSVEPAGEQVAGIAELRQLTGLTWEKLAELFGVSRRSVHHWASGKPMTQGNDEHLQRCLGCLRAADRGDASANRLALFTVVSASGETAFDILARGRYEAALAALGVAADVVPATRAKVGVPVDRLPPPPHVLLSAIEGPSEHSRGASRRVAVVRRERSS